MNELVEFDLLTSFYPLSLSRKLFENCDRSKISPKVYTFFGSDFHKKSEEAFFILFSKMF